MKASFLAFLLAVVPFLASSTRAQICPTAVDEKCGCTQVIPMIGAWSCNQCGSSAGTTVISCCTGCINCQPGNPCLCSTCFKPDAAGGSGGTTAAPPATTAAPPATTAAPPGTTAAPPATTVAPPATTVAPVPPPPATVAPPPPTIIVLPPPPPPPPARGLRN